MPTARTAAVPYAALGAERRTFAIASSLTTKNGGVTESVGLGLTSPAVGHGGTAPRWINATKRDRQTAISTPSSLSHSQPRGQNYAFVGVVGVPQQIRVHEVALQVVPTPGAE